MEGSCEVDFLEDIIVKGHYPPSLLLWQRFSGLHPKVQCKQSHRKIISSLHRGHGYDHDGGHGCVHGFHLHYVIRGCVVCHVWCELPELKRQG